MVPIDSCSATGILSVKKGVGLWMFLCLCLSFFFVLIAGSQLQMFRALALGLLAWLVEEGCC